MTSLADGIAAAYSATGAAWQAGPGRIYDRLADVVVQRSPVPLEGACVLDVGAGTGAATRAALAAGAAGVIAVDPALGMLAYDAHRRPPAAAGDALDLPFAPSVFDSTVAAFSLNHLTDPAAALREMARVTRRGGAVLAATYAADDTHPVRAAVEASLTARGWAPEPWYVAVRERVAALLATLEGCATAVEAAGLDAGAVVEPVRVAFPELSRRDLVSWRLGMAQHAPFLSQLSQPERDAVAADALSRFDENAPPLVRSIIVISAMTR